MVLSSDTLGGGSGGAGSNTTTPSTTRLITATREDRLRNDSVLDGGMGSIRGETEELVDDISCMSLRRRKSAGVSSETSCSSVSTLASYGLAEWETSSAASSSCPSDVGEDLAESYSPTVLHRRQCSAHDNEGRTTSTGTSTPAALAMKGVQALLSSIAEVEREQRVAKQRIDDLQAAITRLKVSYRERRTSHQIVRPGAMAADASRRGICSRSSAPSMEQRPSCQSPSDDADAADARPQQRDHQGKRDSLGSGDDVFDASPKQSERNGRGPAPPRHGGDAECGQRSSTVLMSRYNSAPGLLHLAIIDETIAEDPSAGGGRGGLAAPLDVVEEIVEAPNCRAGEDCAADALLLS